MSFQEPQDPFIEALQSLIDDMRLHMDRQEFKKVLDKIYTMFPFVDLVEFLELYVSGEYSKEMIRRFNLSGYSEYGKLLHILKLGKKRKSKQKGTHSKTMNLTDAKLAKRYEYLTVVLGEFRQYIKDMMSKSTLRMIITLQLYRNGDKFTSKDNITRSVPSIIKHFAHLVPEHYMALLPTGGEKLECMVSQVIQDLDDESLLEVDNSGRIRLEKHQLQIRDYIFNIIRNMEGITHEKLTILLKEKLTVVSHVPHSMILIILDELTIEYKIIRKEGYWKLKPYYDEYFTFDNYVKIGSKTVYYTRKGRRFFGRSITPDEFIEEIIELERGDFEDQDDQVTRIAGMILSNSNMMTPSPNELERFDFAVDLSNYEFTKQQMKIIARLGVDIRSNIVYIRVMINDRVTEQDLESMILDLKDRGRGEQGFVISFIHPDIRAEKILEKDTTIQLISKDELHEWCKITPIIPARRGAVAVVRQGDHMGSIVKIESINYESGKADIVRFPDLIWGTQYIGSLEEITLRVSTDKFVEVSNKYFGFLDKLRQISKVERFRSIVADGLPLQSDLDADPDVSILSKMIECDLGTHYKTRIDLTNDLDTKSLTYSTSGLFSCTCFGWRHRSKSDGLCNHLIYTLNEAVKEILSGNGDMPKDDVEDTLVKIEFRMNTFLDRLRYSNTNGPATVQCPNCGETAMTLDEVKDKFGYRQMNKSNRFSLRRQSRCKKCR